MTAAQSKPVDDAFIPVIDIAPLRDGSDPGGVARALLAASRDVGFIYVAGHGIPDAVIERARETAYAFFCSDADRKAAVAISQAHRGWLARGAAKMQDGAAADVKESFIWGGEAADGSALGDHPLHGTNQWPGFVPGLRTSALDYLGHAGAVAQHLMRGFALGLDLPETFFLRSIAQPLSRASSVYYPAQPAEAGADHFGVGPHTDFGVLTVLCQDTVGGLQVQDLAGEWIDAPPIDGTLVVNVGDLLSRWTNGALRSTPHRVVNRSGRERLSLVLAFDPDPDTMIDAREVVGETGADLDPPITCGDYLIWRFAKAFAYRGA